MSIYDVFQMENELSERCNNDPDNAQQIIKDFVDARTKSQESVESLLKLVKHLEYFASNCKEEEERIKNNRKTAENRIKSIKDYITPYFKEIGAKDFGTFKISIRRSSYVDVLEDVLDKKYMVEKVTYSPDKKAIKDAIQSGEDVRGAKLLERESLQIK